MLEVRPFAAIRFDHTKTGGDLSALIAPPYDVLDQSDKDALLAKSDHNIVAVDLPHLPPKSAGPPECYERAARTLASWLSDGTMVREAQPALYLYHQTFIHEGKTYTRRKFIARVRLRPFADGVILPHELTFGGPKEDRLALMKATKCQLSPIFGLYSDPNDVLGKAFAPTTRKTPDATGVLDGVENKTWLVTDRGLIDNVTTALRDRKLYIADGHHRYGTALMYRDWAKGQNGGSLPDDHPANFCMFVLASMDDPGCLILPYYRALGGVNLDAVLEAWSDGVARCAEDDADLVLMDGASGAEVGVRFTNRAVLRTIDESQCAPWYKLDYAYLHVYLINVLLEEKLDAEPVVRYVKSAGDARRTAREESGVALLTKATPMAHLRAVSEAGGFMPQKSTYFFPKLATGITLNPLA